QKSGDTGEVRIRNAGAIITLRMRRIITQDRERSIAIPKTHQGKYWIDCAFGFGSQCRILAARVTDGPHFSVRSENSAIRGNSLDPSFAQADVGQWLWVANGVLYCLFELVQELSLEAALKLAYGLPGVLEKFFSGEIAIGRVVLM